MLSDPPQSLRHSYDLPRELEAYKASGTHLLRCGVENHIHANAYMRESTMNYGSCDLPQLQGIISLPNDEEQGAYQAPSPHCNLFIWDPYVLNEMPGEFEPVEPFRFLERLPGIKNRPGWPSKLLASVRVRKNGVPSSNHRHTIIPSPQTTYQGLWGIVPTT
jgi:hypothetical protein